MAKKRINKNVANDISIEEIVNSDISIEENIEENVEEIVEEIVEEVNEETTEEIQNIVGQYKTENCKVLLYNEKTKELDVSFQGYGIRLRNMKKPETDYIVVKYFGKVGTPNFTYFA